MKKKILTSAVASSFLITGPTLAQDADTQEDITSAPDGTAAFGIEPYFGIQGSDETYDCGPSSSFNILTNPADSYDGYAIETVLGANLPLGPLFVDVVVHF